MSEERPKVGVGTFILKDGKILLGKRKGSHGQAEYASAGGHLEYGETILDAALREIKEECGIKVKNLRVLCVCDLLSYMPKHYIDIGVYAEWESGEPQTLEPDKCEGWAWYDLDNLPDKQFGCLSAYIEAHKTGKKHFTFLNKN